MTLACIERNLLTFDLVGDTADITYKNLRGNFITQWVVGMCNKLQGEVIEAGTRTTFKRHLGNCMDR